MVDTYAFGGRAPDGMACLGHMVTDNEDARRAPPGAVAGPKRKLFYGVLYVEHPWASTTVCCPCSRRRSLPVAAGCQLSARGLVQTGFDLWLT